VLMERSAVHVADVGRGAEIPSVAEPDMSTGPWWTEGNAPRVDQVLVDQRVGSKARAIRDKNLLGVDVGATRQRRRDGECERAHGDDADGAGGVETPLRGESHGSHGVLDSHHVDVTFE